VCLSVCLSVWLAGCLTFSRLSVHVCVGWFRYKTQEDLLEEEMEKQLLQDENGSLDGGGTADGMSVDEEFFDDEVWIRVWSHRCIRAHVWYLCVCACLCVCVCACVVCVCLLCVCMCVRLFIDSLIDSLIR
jgi:hypothetical protein